MRVWGLDRLKVVFIPYCEDHLSGAQTPASTSGSATVSALGSKRVLALIHGWIQEGRELILPSRAGAHEMQYRRPLKLRLEARSNWMLAFGLGVSALLRCAAHKQRLESL